MSSITPTPTSTPIELSGAEIDTLYRLAREYPIAVDAGDLPSKVGRDALVHRGFAVVLQPDGKTLCTALGVREFLARVMEVDSQVAAALDVEAFALSKSGLDIAHFPGKWKSAMRLAASNQRTDDARLLPFWERVRLLYLELGGEYIGQNGKPLTFWPINGVTHGEV